MKADDTQCRNPSSYFHNSIISQFHISTITNWTLSFPSGWGVPEKVALERLVPWNEIPGFNREARAFSGTAVYETSFECSAENSRLELDLGRVESIAKVFVNDVPVRTLWCEPFRCDISKFVSRGRNSLRVEVTNTWRNRVIYDLGRPKEERKTWMLNQKGFNPRPTDAYGPAGIVGPAKLLTAAAGNGGRISISSTVPLMCKR